MDSQDKVVMLTDKMLEKALAGKHEDLAFIRNWAQLREVRIIRKACRNIWVGFRKAQDMLADKWLKEKKAGRDGYSCVVSFRQLELCINFYKVEEQNAKYILDEYFAYVAAGHLGNFVFNITRSEDDLDDHLLRKLRRM